MNPRAWDPVIVSIVAGWILAFCATVQTEPEGDVIGRAQKQLQEAHCTPEEYTVYEARGYDAIECDGDKAEALDNGEKIQFNDAPSGRQPRQ